MNRNLFIVLAVLIASSNSVTVRSQSSSQDPDHTVHHPSTKTETPIVDRKPADYTPDMKTPDSNSIGMSNRTPMDRDMISMMIRQDEMILAVADLAISRAQRPELKSWAEATKKAKTEESQQLKSWSQQWYGIGAKAMPQPFKKTEKMGNTDGMVSNCMNSMPMMEELMIKESMLSLNTTTTFDRELTQNVIRYNKMAVMMTSMMLDSEHPELRVLAQSIIKERATEIKQFQDWHQSWFL